MVPVSPVWILLSLGSWVVYLLPGFALARFVSLRRPVESWVVISWGLVGMGLAGLLTFYAAVAGTAFGRAAVVVLPLAAFIYLVVSGIRRRGLGSVRPMVPPVLFASAYSLLVNALGFLPGIGGPVFEFARFRFSHSLPVDNTLPYLFATSIWSGETAPHIGGWLSSDRPPLELGTTMQVLGFLRSGTISDLGSQVASVNVQTWMLIAVWAMLLALRVRRKPSILVMLALCASPWVVVNTFFVWPKLLVVAFLAPAVAAVIAPGGKALREHPLLLGASTGLALMAHGSAIFALLGLATLALFRRDVRRACVRPLAIALAPTAVIYGLWAAYQHWIDPPGDRLVKYQLTAVLDVDPRSLWQALVDSYRSLGLEGALAERWEAVLKLFMNPFVSTPITAPPFDQLVFYVRLKMFFSLFWAVGLAWLLLPTVVMLLRRRVSLSPTVRRLLVVAGLSTAWTVLLEFHAGSLHESSYLVPILLLAGLVLAGWDVWPRVTSIVVVAWVVMGTVLVYPLWLPGATHMIWVMGALRSWAVLLMMVILMAGVVVYVAAPWLPRKLWRGKPEASADRGVSATG